jgi:YesN/AraC family two-component response regulator
MQVMVLDDEANIVNGLVYMINQFHIPQCHVAGFTDPAEALDAIKMKGADLVIVDINMPKMSGLVFIEKTQEVSPAKFVILSGYNDFSYAQKAIHLHVREYLVKPVDDVALRKIISGLFTEIYHVSPETYIQPGHELSRHMRDILDYIHKNISGDVSITRLGDAVGLHPSYISSLFVKEMNTGLHKYIENLRLMKAMKMLKDGSNTTIVDIAASLGYTNERQFFRMFKKITNKTPGQFRDSDDPLE